MPAFYSFVLDGWEKCKKNTIWNHEKRAVPYKNLYKFNKVGQGVFLTEHSIFDIVIIIICYLVWKEYNKIWKFHR